MGTGPLSPRPLGTHKSSSAMTLNYFKIGVRNLRVSTIVGAYMDERLKEQEIILNLDLEIDQKGVPISDELCDTVDYAFVAGHLTSWIQSQKSYLIEHLAQLIILQVFNLDSRIKRVDLEIFKPNCIPNADGALVKMSYFRNE